MIYTSPDKVRKVMRNLPPRITDEDITFHIEKAEGYIDALLGEVYQTPFLPVPRIIESITIDLAVFFLAEDLFSSQKPNLDEYHQKRYDRAMDLLKKVTSGDLVIGIPQREQSGFATTNTNQVFTFEDPEW
jgi:phage gp36-like protein